MEIYKGEIDRDIKGRNRQVDVERENECPEIFKKERKIERKRERDGELEGRNV